MKKRIENNKRLCDEFTAVFKISVRARAGVLRAWCGCAWVLLARLLALLAPCIVAIQPSDTYA